MEIGERGQIYVEHHSPISVRHLLTISSFLLVPVFSQLLEAWRLRERVELASIGRDNKLDRTTVGAVERSCRLRLAMINAGGKWTANWSKIGEQLQKEWLPR